MLDDLFCPDEPLSSRLAALLVDIPFACPALRKALQAIERDLAGEMASCVTVGSRKELVTVLRSGETRVAVVARSWPLADAGLLANLPSEHPEVRFFQLLGPWCEGEERTGRVIEGFERFFWDRPLPLIANQSAAPTNPIPPGVVLVESASEETVRAIDDWLAPDGGRAVSIRSWQGEAVGAAVWEGRQLNGREAAALLELRRRLSRSTPLVALLDFPRAETVEAAKTLGATTVLSKPYQATDLLRALTPVSGVNDATRGVRIHAA